MAAKHRPFDCARGLRRPHAAAYVGVSPAKFDEWVRRSIMPAPIRIDRCVIWDRRALDAHFDKLLPEGASEFNEWNVLPREETAVEENPFVAAVRSA